MTKDERLLIEMYRLLSGVEETVDPYQVGKRLGYNERMTTSILHVLMQANLAKRYGPHQVTLTARGRQVAESILKTR